MFVRRVYELLRDRTGTTPMEYGMIAGIVSIAVLVSVGGFANGFKDTYLLLSSTIEK